MLEPLYKMVLEQYNLKKQFLFLKENNMALYNLQNQKLQIIKEESFKLEKDIQSITEKNLEYIFGLKFIKSEFPLNNLRIDTLAFDNDSKSFVIIEYKRDKK